ALARIMGSREFGLYSLVSYWVLVLAMVAKLGFDPGMLRFGAAYLSQGSVQLFRGMVRAGPVVVALAGIALGGLFLALKGILSPRGAPNVWESWLIGAATVPVLALLQLNKV